MRSSVTKLLNISTFTLLLIVGLCAYSVNITVAGGPPAPSGRGCDPMVKPRPECLPLPPAAPTQHAQSQSVTPSPPISQEDYEKAEKVMKEGAGRTGPSGRLSSEKELADIQWYKDNAQITLKSKGGVFTVPADGSKFLVFLDDVKYPVKSLICEPKGVIDRAPVQDTGRSPDLYPVIFMAVAPGSCLLRSDDFSVTIVVKEPTGQ